MSDRSAINAAIAKVAGRQHGNITVKQLNARGLGKQAIWYRVKQGRLYPVFRGVYSVGRPASIPLQRASAAVPRRDIRTQQGIRVTSPARTLLDCAPRLESKERKRSK